MSDKSEIDFEKVLLNMPDAAFIENEEHEIVWANEAARRLLKVEVGDRSVVPVEVTEGLIKGRKDIVVRKLKLGAVTLECKIRSIQKGEDSVSILSILSDVSELEKIAAYWSEIAEEIEERELHMFSQLSSSPPTSVTAQTLGVAPLREGMPHVFSEQVQHYGDLMDLALEQRAYKVEHGVSTRLRSVSERIGFLKAGPRDIVEIHAATLRQKIKGAAPQKAQAYIEEGRLMVLELMGHLASYYRNHSIGS